MCPCSASSTKTPPILTAIHLCRFIRYSLPVIFLARAALHMRWREHRPVVRTAPSKPSRHRTWTRRHFWATPRHSTISIRRPATSRASSLPIPHQFPALSPVPECPALYWQVVAFSAGGEGVRRPPELLATRYAHVVAAGIKSRKGCCNKRQATRLVS